jgi:hypothetical protein
VGRGAVSKQFICRRALLHTQTLALDGKYLYAIEPIVFMFKLLGQPAIPIPRNRTQAVPYYAESQVYRRCYLFSSKKGKCQYLLF